MSKLMTHSVRGIVDEAGVASRRGLPVWHKPLPRPWRSVIPLLTGLEIFT